MKKTNIMKKLSIIIVALLLAAVCYDFILYQGNTYSNFGNYVAVMAKFLKIFSLCLVLLFVSGSFKNIKRYNFLNYISILSVIGLLLSGLFLYIDFIVSKIQSIYLLVYVINGALEKVVICLILISLFVINSDGQKVSNNQG